MFFRCSDFFEIFDNVQQKSIVSSLRVQLDVFCCYCYAVRLTAWTSATYMTCATTRFTNGLVSAIIA